MYFKKRGEKMEMLYIESLGCFAGNILTGLISTTC